MERLEIKELNVEIKKRKILKNFYKICIVKYKKR